MPSTNELAAFHRINPATAAKGVNQLVDDGILYKRRGIGMFVAAGAREPRCASGAADDFADQYLQPLLAEARKLGIGHRASSTKMIDTMGGPAMTAVVTAQGVTRALRRRHRPRRRRASRCAENTIYGLLGPQRRRQDHADADPHRPGVRRRPARLEVFGAAAVREPTACCRAGLLRQGEPALPDVLRRRATCCAPPPGCSRTGTRTFARLAGRDFHLPTERAVQQAVARHALGARRHRRLAARAPLTFFDEPYLGLDAVARQIFYDRLLADYAEHPRTVVLSTHLIDEVGDLIERVLLLDTRPARARRGRRGAARPGGHGHRPGGGRRRLRRRAAPSCTASGSAAWSAPPCAARSAGPTARSPGSWASSWSRCRCSSSSSA